MRKVADRPLAAGDPQLRTVDLVERPFHEALEHPKLIEDLHRRRMDRVTPKIAEEIGMLLEHLHAAASPREQQSGHHARWAAANYDQVEVGILLR